MLLANETFTLTLALFASALGFITLLKLVRVEDGGSREEGEGRDRESVREEDGREEDREEDEGKKNKGRKGKYV